MRAAGAFRGGRASAGGKRGTGGPPAGVSGAAPTITAAANPATGAAGDTVTITGTGFVEGGTTFKETDTNGAALTSVSVINSTTATGVMPAHADGAVALFVSTANGTGSRAASFTYAAAAPAALFRSDWSTATGQTDAALRDTGKASPWTHMHSNPEAEGAVVAATSLGFPATMTNVFRVQHDTHTTSCLLAKDNAFAAPVSGGYIYIRFYWRADFPNTFEDGGASYHWFEGNNSGDLGSPTVRSHLEVKMGSWDDGKVSLFFATPFESSPNHQLWINTDGPIESGLTKLNKNATYRIEIRIHFASATKYGLAFRLYDTDDTTLLYQDGATGLTKVVNNNGVNIASLGENFNVQNLEWFRSWELGNNGWVNFPSTGYKYIGGVCFRSDTWCGAYNASTG